MTETFTPARHRIMDDFDGFRVELDPERERSDTTLYALPEQRIAQRTFKAVLNAAQNTTVEAGIEIEGNAHGRLRTSEDFGESVSGFHEKRKAKFKGV
jgi:enoyl-CoA hydratase/carnithine racemase